MAKQQQMVMLTCRVERKLLLALNVAAKVTKLKRSELVRQALLIAVVAVRDAA